MTILISFIMLYVILKAGKNMMTDLISLLQNQYKPIIKVLVLS